jgi:hypothetical protein
VTVDLGKALSRQEARPRPFGVLGCRRIEDVPTPPMIPVESSSIRAIGYDTSACRLHVEFHTGARYVYDGVHARAHRDLLTAESIGAHFNRHVRDAYPCRKTRAA